MAKVVKQQHINRQIKGEIFNSLRDALVAPQGKSKQSWTDAFIKEMLKEAKSNPSGPLGQLLARQLMQDDIISSLDEQTEKLLMRDTEFLRYRIIKQLFKNQRDVLLDYYIRRKCLCTGRRSGKTNTLARLLVDTCVEPNIPTLYIHTKFENAIKQCFQLCVDAANEAELVIESSSENEGTIKFANGSSITFKGNNNRAAADMMRGGKYKLICIDEAAYECNMNYLVNDVCEPMLVDYEGSMLVLASTPPRIPKTFFEKAYNGSEYKNYEWNMLDNPFIPNAKEELDKLIERKGLTKDDPFVQREYFGKFFYDTEAQVFKGYQTYQDLPKDFIPTHIAIGVDYGFEDNNAIVSLAYNINTKNAFVIKDWNMNHIQVSTILDETKKAYEDAKKYFIDKNGVNANVNNIKIYTDCNEKMISYELYKNHLPAFTCYKYDKDLAISQLSDWCRTGKIKIEKDKPLDDEFQSIVYKRDDEDNILSEIDEETFHGNSYMALLYASRQMWFDMGDELGGQSKNAENGWNN